MSDTQPTFDHYTPDEYVSEHIRITPTTLADGRALFYMDDDPELVSGQRTRARPAPRTRP
ncbi:MAG: galactose-1-phosphate uridylyltransferase, partial [Bifidobacterium aquikefiri]